MTLYVLEHNRHVINGPRAWNYRSFESTLNDELEITHTLPLSKTDESIITISDEIHIYPARYDYPIYNQRLEYLHGPFWDYSSGIATGTFEILPKSIELVKQELKQKVAVNRYNREIAGTTISINGTVYTIDTNRGNRDVYIQQYILLGNADTIQWKFPEGWVTLTKIDLGLIATECALYIQEQFKWEAERCNEIDLLETADELDNVDVGYQVGHAIPPDMEM